MLQKELNNNVRIVQLIFLVGLLVLVRVFENQLFYDPFLNYFKEESISAYPEINFVKLYLNLCFRYFLNTIISLTILYVIFKDVALVKFSAVLYSLFFILLLIGFYIYLNYFDESHKMIFFYIRRFLIQPIFILLFIPGFYFQTESQKK
ncbi:MAG: exosortase F system-associated protein [Flavobacterium sp.]